MDLIEIIKCYEVDNVPLTKLLHKPKQEIYFPTCYLSGRVRTNQRRS